MRSSDIFQGNKNHRPSWLGTERKTFCAVSQKQNLIDSKGMVCFRLRLWFFEEPTWRVNRMVCLGVVKFSEIVSEEFQNKTSLWEQDKSGLWSSLQLFNLQCSATTHRPCLLFFVVLHSSESVVNGRNFVFFFTDYLHGIALRHTGHHMPLDHRRFLSYRIHWSSISTNKGVVSASRPRLTWLELSWGVSQKWQWQQGDWSGRSAFQPRGPKDENLLILFLFVCMLVKISQFAFNFFPLRNVSLAHDSDEVVKSEVHWHVPPPQNNGLSQNRFSSQNQFHNSWGDCKIFWAESKIISDMKCQNWLKICLAKACLVLSKWLA